MGQRLHIVLERESEGGYSAHVPELPGCASQGESQKEALRNIREAIALYLESLKEDGLPVPSGTDVVVKEIEVAS